MSNVRTKAPKGFMSIDPIRGVIQRRGEGSGVMILPSPWEGEPDRVYRVNPRTVDHKRKAKDRAHRKRVKKQKATRRRAGW